jgi:hypothetical protein
MDVNLAVTAGLGPADRRYAACCSAGTHLTGISQLSRPIAGKGSTFSRRGEFDNDRPAGIGRLAQRSEALEFAGRGGRIRTGDLPLTKQKSEHAFTNDGKAYRGK